MKNRILSRETIIKKPIEIVFDFFSKAENLNLITPPHLQFKIITPLPIKISKGTIIDYSLKLYGFPFKWKTEIKEWEPPFKFVDAQLKGPYLRWVHQHTFFQDGNNTIMIDNVEYLSPGWIIEPLIHGLFVKKNVENIFDYRKTGIEKYLE
jgi:ligand-binding SRPBCC domain-containing protein